MRARVAAIAGYVAAQVPGAIGRLGLTPDGLANLATAKLAEKLQTAPPLLTPVEIAPDGESHA